MPAHLNAFELALKLYVAGEAAAAPQLGFGYVYRNWLEFVFQHGEFFEPRVKPKVIPWRAPGVCFANAIAVAHEHGWKYVEGLALGQEAVHHAWNLDNDGRVIDTTWRAPGKAYLGIVFSAGRADDATWYGDATVLDDNHRGWPLLKRVWTGDDFTRQWPASPALQLVVRSDAATTDEERQALERACSALRAREGL